MPARQKSCCFTGHRPAKLPWGYREEDPRCITLKARIFDAVTLRGRRATAILSVAWRRAATSIFARLCWHCGSSTRRLRWRPRFRVQHRLTRGRKRNGSVIIVWWRPATWETMVSGSYSPSCMQRRDRYMVDHSMLLIAAFDGSAGGTRYTVGYALRQGIEIFDVSIPTE